MIHVEKINKSFNSNKILNDVSFVVDRGDFLAVMGPSGSGKSTLLYSISGMDRIDAGKVVFNGAEITKLDESELSKFRLNSMGFVFQNAQMLKNLTVFDNIILPGLVAKKESSELLRERAVNLMKCMGIEGLENRDIRQVSGGQLQRASICRAMINHPDILFLDEPTGALNSSATEQVLEILEGLNNDGMTIMTVTHDFRVAARAKKVIYILDGEIAACKEFASLDNREEELAEWLEGLNVAAICAA
jgi:putative ABC transport system ATP-binding protein